MGDTGGQGQCFHEGDIVLGELGPPILSVR